MERVNEAGLKLSLLSLEASTYQNVPEGEMDKAMGFSDVTSWLLGTCDSVEEVKAALKGVYV